MSVVAFPAPDQSHGEASPARCSPSPEEGLRLVFAFMKIEDADMRAQLIRLAERLAAHGT
jgi:hypothetical protein